MKRILLLVGMLMCFAVIARGAPESSLFPVQEGNYWILKSSLGDQKIIRCEPGTNGLLQLTGLSERPVTFYGSEKSTRLYRWGLGTPVNFPVPPPPGSGDLYWLKKAKFHPVVSLRPLKKSQSAFSAGEHECDQLLVELDPITTPIRTKTGLYTDCSILWITTANQPIFTVCDLKSERIYFAPGVGPVAIQGRLDRLYLLVEAQVGDSLIGGQ